MFCHTHRRMGKMDCSVLILQGILKEVRFSRNPRQIRPTEAVGCLGKIDLSSIFVAEILNFLCWGCLVNLFLQDRCQNDVQIE